MSKHLTWGYSIPRCFTPSIICSSGPNSTVKVGLIVMERNISLSSFLFSITIAAIQPLARERWQSMRTVSHSPIALSPLCHVYSSALPFWALVLSAVPTYRFKLWFFHCFKCEIIFNNTKALSKGISYLLISMFINIYFCEFSYWVFACQKSQGHLWVLMFLY